MTTTNTQGAADLLTLIEAYAELRHKQGYRSYNANTYAAWQAVKDAIAGKEATHLRELAAYRLTVENLERELAAQQPQQSMSYAGLPVERAAFEAWLRSIWTAGYNCPKFDSGRYVHGDAQQFWECWQARAARAPADSVCYDYAKQIAESMWAKHYKADAPHWESCDSLMGVLCQISNMMCGLSRAPADSVQEDAARWNAWAGGMVEACNSDEQEPAFLVALDKAIGDAEPPVTLELLNAWTDAARKQGEKQ